MAIYKIIFGLRLYLSRWPETYLVIYRQVERVKILLSVHKKDQYSSCAVDQSIDLVIEGYPRCANSFCIRAFYFNNNNSNVRVAHHLHSSAQVLFAVKYNIPTIVLIREPTEAILSYLIRTPNITPKMALKGYIQFYSTIESYKDNYILADFSEVIRDFGQVVERVNHKYQSNFDIFCHSPENVKECFRLSELRNKRIQLGKEEMIARPSSIKDGMKENIRFQLESKELLSLLKNANKIYNSLSN